MTIPVTAPTPYITPDILTSAPTGVAWSTIPSRDASAEEKTAELWNICQRATAEVDEYANVTMRATVDSEAAWGPGDFRFQMRPDGTARILLSRGPVVQVLSGRWSSSSAFPRSWTALAGSDFAIEKPPLDIYSPISSGGGEGGMAVILRPGVASWAGGRLGTLVEVTYVNGWPHAALTQDAAAGATTINVDETAGWWTGEFGATGIVYDGGAQERATAAGASATGGPGTLTLAAPLTYPHAAGTLISTLPTSIQWATILYAAAEALTRGATATTVQQAPGTGVNTAGNHDVLRMRAQEMISAYRRVV